MDLATGDAGHQQTSAIIVAPNGARKTKRDHPNLPMTEEEIISEVIACRDAGAAMVHLHCRDDHGQHSLEIEPNRQLYDKVKQAVGDSIIVQLTTEAVGIYSAQQQIALTKAVKPEAASFALRELIPDDNHIKSGKAFFHWVAEHGIISQIILYDQDDIDRYFQLRALGILPTMNQHALVVLGRYHNEEQSSPWDLKQLDLSLFVQQNVHLAVCAFGDREQDCLISAMLLGLDVRVGFENNHLDPQGIPAINNAEQVRNLKKINKLLNICIHDAYSFRKALSKN
ncbi:beta-keto acid cleavage family enzyme [Vibrio coralliilyticus]|uniref:3-keto-5-aminohexanoate cleavage protein n=1 Tax=Vibrio coralliilyticus TaxID=190893 RepID=UPI001E589998|nr:3-keto-5-aminohexanoate cleavage protein [Vibrio coralliilyticus]MCC2521629.1 3-keto-5-aminohexanoate cleavage protein [Vibrio coralliilyticus]